MASPITNLKDSGMARLKLVLQTGASGLMLLLCFGWPQPVWAGGWMLKDQNGARYSQSDLHGRWVLVNFWAPWCPTCLAEMPDLITLQQQHKDLLVIGVAVMFNSKKEVAEVVRDNALNYPVVMGNEDIASEFGGMKGMPTSFLYTPDGKMIAKYEGPITVGEVERLLSLK